jgi:hypothetical protein
LAAGGLDRIGQLSYALHVEKAMWYTAGMVKTLEIAISKVSALTEAAQEQLGREILERIETLAQLRAEIEIGVRELDAGLGEKLDIEAVISEARAENARKA